MRTLEAIAQPIELFSLGRTNNISSWIHSAAVALCMRPESLTVDECATISREDTWLLLTARNALRSMRLDDPTETEVSAYVRRYIVMPPVVATSAPSSRVPPQIMGPNVSAN